MSDRTGPAVGMRLRTAREAKGISLREIADATKISTRALAAVERHDLSKLPGGIFTRSFIRSYAEYVGLDPDAILDDFFAECPDQVEPVPTLEIHPVAQEGVAAWLASLGAAPSLVAFASWRRALVPVMLAVFVVGGYSIFGRTTSSEGVIPAGPVEVLTAHGLLAVPLEPVVTRVAQALNGLEPDVPVTALASSTLRVELRSHAPCWIALGIDGGPIDSRMLEAGERTVIEAASEVLLKVGDAGAIVLSINGRPAGRLGGSGQVVTKRISAETLPEHVGG